jgi:hypothetical protein
MLADLASRLQVLLDGLTDPAYAPLVALVAYLAKGGELDARWAEATRVLEAFAGAKAGRRSGADTTPKPAAPERKAFWKR